MSYFEESATLPPPFNIFPTPKIVMKLFGIRKKNQPDKIKVIDAVFLFCFHAVSRTEQGRQRDSENLVLSVPHFPSNSELSGGTRRLALL